VQAVHCGGCRGWTRDWKQECPGVQDEGTLGTVRVTRTFVSRLSLRDRLRVLAGRRVIVTTSAVSYGGGGGGGYTPPEPSASGH
jgi:hypothetical protein